MGSKHTHTNAVPMVPWRRSQIEFGCYFMRNHKLSSAGERQHTQKKTRSPITNLIAVFPHKKKTLDRDVLSIWKDVRRRFLGWLFRNSMDRKRELCGGWVRFGLENARISIGASYNLENGQIARAYRRKLNPM